MCGFCGFTGEVENRDGVLAAMAEAITHRGPDAFGSFSDEHFAVAFRRLSIIDLAHGDQPLYNEDGSLVLTFNGEIYNYRSLREDLRDSGHTFVTESDSEVLLHGFEEWGEGLLNRLRGMFAFAIYNKTDGSLFMARDFFGIKPLHYATLSTGAFAFASEIKSFLPHPDFVKEFNPIALDHYLSFQYSLPPQTFFKGVLCLPPACFLWVRDGVPDEPQRYWQAEFFAEESMELDQAVELIDAAFTDSVEAHRISDVEVGCFLSGGVDSSFVASYFAGQKAFTVGFDNGEHYNECAFAAEFAEEMGISHFSHLISEQEYWDVLPAVQYHLDQPLADPACVALYFVSKLAAEQVKVVLSGEGADELFGGYRIYAEPAALAKYQRLPLWLRKAAAKAVSWLPAFKGQSFMQRGAKTLEERFIGNAFMFTEEDKRRLLKDIPATDPRDDVKPLYALTVGKDDVTRMQTLDIHAWMVGDILLKADRMSMAHSLELRVPFLDKEVFKVAAAVPAKHRVACGTTKYAMRLAAARHMPQKSTARPKLGFPVPVRVWLRTEGRYTQVKAAFTSAAAEKFFDTAELVKLLDAHYKGKKDNSRKIWTVYMFLVWYGEYFGEEAADGAQDKAGG